MTILRNKWAAVLAAVMVMGIVGGCTVRPKIVLTHGASFDGSERNSGLIGHDVNGLGILTPHARDRYNALIETYGKQYRPPLTPDYGITPTATNTFLITKEGLVKFQQMNIWKRENKKPNQ